MSFLASLVGRDVLFKVTALLLACCVCLILTTFFRLATEPSKWVRLAFSLGINGRIIFYSGIATVRSFVTVWGAVGCSSSKRLVLLFVDMVTIRR